MTPRLLAALNGLLLLVALLVGGLLVSEAPAADPAALSVRPGSPAPSPAAPVGTPAPVAPTTPAASPVATPTTTPAASAPSSPATSAPPAVPPAVPRTATTTGFAPYAEVGPVVLHAPGEVVEAIGFHQAGHDGAQPQAVLPGRVRAGALEDRGRGTHPSSAADVVVDPAREVRSPVTGTVVRAGSYALYCDSVDQYLVVEPDARPGWEVKVLHVHGLSVGVGDRVQAGVTVVAAGARPLPFASQIDAFTAEPSWPHVHVEVVDPSVPDRPGTGGGGGC